MYYLSLNCNFSRYKIQNKIFIQKYRKKKNSKINKLNKNKYKLIYHVDYLLYSLRKKNINIRNIIGDNNYTFYLLLVLYFMMYTRIYYFSNTCSCLSLLEH